jgi:hypothetical protein
MELAHYGCDSLIELLNIIPGFKEADGIRTHAGE